MSTTNYQPQKNTTATMGYVVLHLDKATGTDAAMSGHIERKIAPGNADATLTYLNEELVEFSKGVANRTEAIQHRLDNVGLQRKIGKNQVRAIRVLLSASPEDMKRIRQSGQLDAWCKDSKREQAKTSDKRTYRKKKVGPRLCADDVMSRPKLKEYQTTYAEAMAKYGLKRGIDGSEAKHITGSQFYREVFVRRNEIAGQVEAMVGQKETLSVDIAALQAQREAALSELAQTRREIKTDKLKGAAVEATTKAVERIGALFHDPKSAKYEQQIAELQRVIADRDNKIKDLHREIGTIRAEHEQEKAELKQQKQEVLKALIRIDDLFPHVKGLLKWENYCMTLGLNKAWTKALFTMQPYRYSGELHSRRYGLTFKAHNVVLQFKPDKGGPGGFRMTIDGKDDSEWFREQRKVFYQRIGIDIEPAQGRGIKI